MAKPVILRPVYPSAGLEAEYRKKLDRLIGEMHRSLVYWLSATYRGNPPEMAGDESPAMAMRNAMRRLGQRWQRQFDRLAAEYAPEFAKRTKRYADAAFAQRLKKAGFTVQFKMSPEVNDVVQAAVGENVSLIKSIAEQHLTQVEGAVMRSVSAGRDLASLVDDLEARYGVTRRRAAFIARDQVNKATAAVTRARQTQLGIEEAVWMHSHGGNHPRPTHVAMNGQRYKVSEGMWDPALKRRIWPGTEPNCRCVARSVVPGFA